MSARSRRASPARIALVFLLIAAALTLAGAAGATRRVIPPGQEAVVLRMLGGDLPAGCRLLGASIEVTEIRARYACAIGEVRVVVRHPGDAPSAAVRAEQLALLVGDGSAAPPELVAALGARMRAEEAGFRWILEGRSFGRTMDQTGISPRARRLALAGGAAAAIAFAAVLFAALAAARRWPMGDGAARPWSMRREAAAALITAAIGALVLAFGYPTAPVHPDTTRDLVMAAECAAGGPCDQGPPTSLGVFVQGALWTRALAAARGAGLSVAATVGTSLVLQAFAAALMLIVVRRSPRPELAPWAAGLALVGGAFLVEAPILWNPTLAPLPLAAFFALLTALAVRREGSLALAVGAAIALGLAIECHLLFAVLAPVLLAATAACARRPIVATIAAAAALAAVLWIDARAAWTVNARALVESGAAIPLAVALIVAAGSGAAARARMEALAPWSRAIVLVATAGVYTAGARVVLHVALGAAANRRYLAPALPALAIAGAWIVVEAARRIAHVTRARRDRIEIAAGALALVGARAALPAVTRGHHWALAEAEKAAPAVYARLPTYPAATARLRTRTPSLMAAMAIFEPRAPRAGGEGDDDVVLLRLGRGAAPARAEVIDLGREKAVIARVAPFLDRARMSICFAPQAGASADAGCVDAGLARHVPVTAEERAYPALTAVRDAFPTELLERMGEVKQTVIIAVRAAPGPAHRVELFDDGSGLVIERVSGVRSSGALPARRVVIEGGSGEGELVVSGPVSRDRKRAGPWWLPPLIEIEADDRAAAQALDEGEAE